MYFPHSSAIVSWRRESARHTYSLFCAGFLWPPGNVRTWELPRNIQKTINFDRLVLTFIPNARSRSVRLYVRSSVRQSVIPSEVIVRTKPCSPHSPPPLFLASLSADNEQLIWHSCSRALVAFLLVNFLDTLNIYVRIDSRTDIPIPVSSTFRMINRKINIKWACFVDGLFRF